MQSNDEQQLAQLGDWWQRNGKPLLWGAIVAAALVLAWQAWQRIKHSRQEEASSLYELLLESAFVPENQLNLAQVGSLGEQLKKNYGSTAYGQYGSLVLAKVAVDHGKLEDAAAELRGVLAKPATLELDELARQRLAKVLSAQDKPEEALALLSGTAPKAYLADREELRGDLLVRLKRHDEALAAYRKAKEALGQGVDGNLLQMKLDDLAKGDA